MTTTSSPHRCTPTVWPAHRYQPDEPIQRPPLTEGQYWVALWPWPVESTARPGTEHRFWWLGRLIRRGAVGMLVVSLLLGLGGALALGAAAPAAAQPAPTPPPVPATPGAPVSCVPGSPQQDECLHPSTTLPAPCTGPGCIPQPSTSTPPPTSPPTGQPGDVGSGEGDCGITNIAGCVTTAVNAFFRSIVTDALNPLLELLSGTLLTTPSPESLPHIGELWTNSWQIVLACYAMLVLIAGVLVMGYESVQTRYSLKEIAPRIVVGFLAAALSLWAATTAIQIANALSHALMGEGVQATSAGQTLKSLILGSLDGRFFIILLGVVLVGMLLVLLVTYIVRVALTIILIAGAPLALMCHALPQTEGIARWWWKAFGGCLAIQLGQSLTLITAMKVFLAPGGVTLFGLFGPTRSDLVTLLVSLALLYILVKIPFWILGSLRGGGGRSFLTSLARGAVISKTVGLLGTQSSGGQQRHTPRSHSHRSHRSRDRAPADPDPQTRTTANGQHLLPPTGLRRSTTGQTPHSTWTTRSAPTRRAPQTPQPTLALGEDWPENTPRLRRDGHDRLPLHVERSNKPAAKPSTQPSGSASSGAQRRGRTGRQLQLPLDPHQGNRPTRAGQYPLPRHGLRQRPAATPTAQSRPPTTPAPAGTHLRLPIDLPPTRPMR